MVIFIYDKDSLVRVTRTASSFSDIQSQLGIRSSWRTAMDIERSLLFHGIEYGHIIDRRRPRYSREELEQAVMRAVNPLDIHRLLGLNPALNLQVKIDLYKYAIDCSKFSAYPRQHYDLMFLPQHPPIESMLVKNSPYKVETIKKKLIERGLLANRCYLCGLTHWRYMGELFLLRLEIDHINGDKKDNRIENLRLLCGNCHSQTETFAGKNKRLNLNSVIDLNKATNLLITEKTLTRILVKLGLHDSVNNREWLRTLAANRGIDISRFWRIAVPGKKSREQVLALCRTGSGYKTYRLKKLLIDAKILLPHCELCGIIDWQGKPLPFNLDHKNGVKNDHRIENLRILCVNCDSYTEFFRARNAHRSKLLTNTEKLAPHIKNDV